MSGTVTVDAAAWALHQKALALLNKMADHPEKGIDFKKLAKTVDPTLQFTELDTHERLQAPILEKLTATEAALQAIREEREAEKLERQQADTVRKLSGDVDAAVKKFSLTDDGREKMTARMQEKGNLDAEAAAAWVASQTPKAKPSQGTGTFGPSALNAYGSAEKDDAWAELHHDPVRWQDKEIAAFLNEEPLAG
jgi:hypothetical protein